MDQHTQVNECTRRHTCIYSHTQVLSNRHPHTHTHRQTLTHTDTRSFCMSQWPLLAAVRTAAASFLCVCVCACMCVCAKQPQNRCKNWPLQEMITKVRPQTQQIIKRVRAAVRTAWFVYLFIYLLASNLVHFSPESAKRECKPSQMGWGGGMMGGGGVSAFPPIPAWTGLSQRGRGWEVTCHTELETLS